eukprot:1150866-Pelagomonas_calceolata.AAC.1
MGVQPRGPPQSHAAGDLAALGPDPGAAGTAAAPVQGPPAPTVAPAAAAAPVYRQAVQHRAWGRASWERVEKQCSLGSREGRDRKGWDSRAT